MADQKKEILSVTRTKAEAQASYDRMSKVYDVLIASGERRYRDAGLSLLDIQAGERVLEVGSGTGHCLVALAEKTGRSGLVTGIDLSPGMIAVAQKRIAGTHFPQLISTICGDAAHLPYQIGSFDAVLLSFTLELFDTPEIPKVLEECLRVLKFGGRLCVISLSREGKQSVMTRLYEWGHVRFPKLLDCRPIYLNQSFEDAGFEILSSTELPYFGLSVAISLGQKI